MIFQHPQNVFIIAGDPGKMSCSASGLPRPTIRWYKLTENGDLPLPANGNHKISVDFTGAKVSTSHLTISVSLLADVASYFCAASNIIGSATSDSALLTVNSKTFSRFSPVLNA